MSIEGIEDKRLFAKLLMAYMSEMMDASANNEKCDNTWNIHHVFGVKAQYNHASCILKRINEDIKRELK